jgi:hypothetical protein
LFIFNFVLMLVTWGNSIIFNVEWYADLSSLKIFVIFIVRVLCRNYFLLWRVLSWVDTEILCEFGRLFYQWFFFCFLTSPTHYWNVSDTHTQKLINFHPEMLHKISKAYFPFFDCEKYVVLILVFQLFHHLRYIFPRNRSSFEQWHMKHFCVYLNGQIVFLSCLELVATKFRVPVLPR